MGQTVSQTISGSGFSCKGEKEDYDYIYGIVMQIGFAELVEMLRDDEEAVDFLVDIDIYLPQDENELNKWINKLSKDQKKQIVDKIKTFLKEDK